MRKFGLVLGVFAAGFGLLPSSAQAHFLLNAPQSWWSSASDGSPQKMAPCGNETTTGTSATKVVTTVQPGQSIPVQVMATVSHPGWYRISLKQGASATQTAAAFPDPPTLSGTGKQCTPAFIDNPVWSPTQPVLADKLGLPAGSTSTTTTQSGAATFNVTIPSNATCTSASPCTLQVLMFMTDHPAGSCNYHHCADIAVQTAGTAGAGGHGGAAGSGGGAKGGAAGSASDATGGTSAAGGASGAGGALGATGGAPSSGSGGSIATGGTPGTGGTASGGNNATGGTTGAAGAPAGGDMSGGCSFGAGAKAGSKLGIAIVLVLAVAAAHRRRRRSRRF